MENDKTIGVLNTLLKSNNDRIEGYDMASKNTEAKDLRKLFSEFRQTSQKCRHELISEITNLNGRATEDTKASGKFFRDWMDAKSSLTGDDREAILNSCEYGEKQADETYQTVLNDQSENLNPLQVSMVKMQHKQLKADQSKIKSMLSRPVEAS